jgi:DNA mismatch repair protein MutS
MARRIKPALQGDERSRAPADDVGSGALQSVARQSESEPVAAPAIEDATPSMAQYLEIKAANPDSLLWYRMGDFYELFFEDAVAASAALGIVLTKRGKHQGADIPMCGVPIHRADEYLQRLIRQGFRVAVCEQLEDPAEARKRGSKAVVKRDVVRLVTPGTLTEDSLLDAKARNYLTAVFRSPAATGCAAGPLCAESRLGLASLDISTGELETTELSGLDLPGELMRLEPREILATDDTLSDGELKRWIGVCGAAATPVPTQFFDSLAGEHTLKTQLKVATLKAFGEFTRSELAAAAALLRYVDLTQIGAKPALRPPKRSGPGSTLTIDAATRTSLELMRSYAGDRQGSLLAAIDRTVTAAGARELAARLSSPLTNVSAIEQRLDAVAFFVEEAVLRHTVRELLRGAPDIARALSRLSFGRGGPRDLAAIRDGLKAARSVHDEITGRLSPLGPSPEIARILAGLDQADRALAQRLDAALVDDPPHVRRDGGFVREGYHTALDEARTLRSESRGIIAGLESRYSEETGVKSLKIRHNNILGYYIEVSTLQAKVLTSPPHDVVFRHRQTMANAMRFTTPELVDIEGRIAAAAERALALEQEIFQDLATAVAANEAGIHAVAGALAECDVLTSLAELAVTERYVRPTISEGVTFEIRGGRHPVVEQALERSRSGAFIENDCILGFEARKPTGFDEETTQRIWLVTGPNMAGKSTFLRQNALITVLAQMGSFVPARSAHIGVVDRLFSRVGAADDLARGRSTFMVEMVETAGILNQATARSLVILDEIGRGTATFDGLSIAWATVEYLHEVVRCRTLFATHYHEMTALAGRLKDVGNVTMDVKEWQDEIVFLHKVRPGAADRSYGIQVAKLAGLPQPVIARATEVLELLETSEAEGSRRHSLLDDLPLFAAARPRSSSRGHNTPAVRETSAVDAALAALDPDELTPKAALDTLYELKRLASQAKN